VHGSLRQFCKAVTNLFAILILLQTGLCPFAQMDETVYLAEECQTGFFAQKARLH